LRPQRSRLCNLLLERLAQRFRQHHHAILAALAITHDDDLASEVNVLYA
jgi:hypothetical protein